MAQLKNQLPNALYGVLLKELIQTHIKNLFLAKGRDGFVYEVHLNISSKPAYRKLTVKHLAA